LTSQNGQRLLLDYAELTFALWSRKVDFDCGQASEHLPPEEREVLGRVNQVN